MQFYKRRRSSTQKKSNPPWWWVKALCLCLTWLTRNLSNISQQLPSFIWKAGSCNLLFSLDLLLPCPFLDCKFEDYPFPCTLPWPQPLLDQFQQSWSPLSKSTWNAEAQCYSFCSLLRRRRLSSYVDYNPRILNESTAGDIIVMMSSAVPCHAAFAASTDCANQGRQANLSWETKFPSLILLSWVP